MMLIRAILDRSQVSYFAPSRPSPRNVVLIAWPSILCWPDSRPMVWVSRRSQTHSLRLIVRHLVKTFMWHRRKQLWKQRVGPKAWRLGTRCFPETKAGASPWASTLDGRSDLGATLLPWHFLRA